MQNFSDLVQEEHFQIRGWMDYVTLSWTVLHFYAYIVLLLLFCSDCCTIIRLYSADQSQVCKIKSVSLSRGVEKCAFLTQNLAIYLGDGETYGQGYY